jgi:hypothetical protein
MDPKDLRWRLDRIDEVTNALARVEALAADVGPDADAAAREMIDRAIEHHRSTLAVLQKPRTDALKHYGRADSLVGLGTPSDRRRYTRTRALEAVKAWLGGRDIGEAVEALAVAVALTPEATDADRSEMRELIDRDQPRGEGTTFARWCADLEQARCLDPIDGTGPYARALAVVVHFTDWSADTFRSDTRGTKRSRRQV